MSNKKSKDDKKQVKSIKEEQLSEETIELVNQEIRNYGNLEEIKADIGFSSAQQHVKQEDNELIALHLQEKLPEQEKEFKQLMAIKVAS